MLKYKLAVFALMAALLAGCASNTVPDPDPTDTSYGDDGGADTGVYGDDPMADGEAFGDDYAAGELTNVIYFDFDSAEVRADFTDIGAFSLFIDGSSTSALDVELNYISAIPEPSTGALLLVGTLAIVLMRRRGWAL